jgi:hypothetical protein
MVYYSLLPKILAEPINMIDYEYSDVIVQLINDRNEGSAWVEKCLKLEPRDEMLHLSFHDYGYNNIEISFDFYIEDWRDLFPRLIEERIFLDRSGRLSDIISPAQLQIQGTCNPLISIIIYAFCSHDAAKLCLRLIDCSQDELEQLLIKNRNFRSRMAVKYAGLIDKLLNDAFLRIKYIMDSDCQISQIIKKARQTIQLNDEISLKIQKQIEETNNVVLLREGPFLIVEIFNPDPFDNIYDVARYAVVYVDDYHLAEPDKIPVSAIGNRVDNGYTFSLTFAHVDWTFTCDSLVDIPRAAFNAIESYMDMTS